MNKEMRKYRATHVAPVRKRTSPVVSSDIITQRTPICYTINM